MSRGKIECREKWVHAGYTVYRNFGEKVYKLIMGFTEVPYRTLEEAKEKADKLAEAASWGSYV